MICIQFTTAGTPDPKGPPDPEIRKAVQAAIEGGLRGDTEPPRVCRRVICSMTRRPYRVCSGLHRTPPLLLRG